jgi:hypothetical protein
MHKYAKFICVYNFQGLNLNSCVSQPTNTHKYAKFISLYNFQGLNLTSCVSQESSLTAYKCIKNL